VSLISPSLLHLHSILLVLVSLVRFVTLLNGPASRRLPRPLFLRYATPAGTGHQSPLVRSFFPGLSASAHRYGQQSAPAVVRTLPISGKRTNIPSVHSEHSTCSGKRRRSCPRCMLDGIPICRFSRRLPIHNSVHPCYRRLLVLSYRQRWHPVVVFSHDLPPHLRIFPHSSPDMAKSQHSKAILDWSSEY
jgi:hypothetical protein